MELTQQEHDEMLWYFNEWLGLWNDKFIPEYWMTPRGNEPNYTTAKEISDYLSKELSNIPL